MLVNVNQTISFASVKIGNFIKEPCHLTKTADNKLGTPFAMCG